MKLINKKSLLVSAISLTLASGLALAEVSGYLSIHNVKSEVEGKGAKKILEVEIKTNRPIPVDGKSGAFGYAILTDNTNNVLVLVTHLPIDDSSHEDPVNGVSRVEETLKIRAHIWRRITLSSTQQKRAVIGPLFI